MRTSALVDAKNLGFSKIYGVSARTGGGVSQCGHFSDKGGEGVNFVRTSFIDAPNHKNILFTLMNVRVGIVTQNLLYYTINVRLNVPT